MLKKVILGYADGSGREVVINEVRFLKYGAFDAGQNKIEVDTRNLISAMIDTTRYIVRKYPNPLWVIQQSDIVVLQRIENGRIKLYSTALKFHDRILFAEKDTTFRELRRYDKIIEGRHLLKVDEYKSILQFMILGCEFSSVCAVDDLELRFDEVVNFIRCYNRSCVTDLPSIPLDSVTTQLANKKVDREEAKEYGAVTVLAGYAFANATVKFDPNYWPKQFGSTSTMALGRPFAGVGFRLFRNRLPFRVSLRTQSTFEALNSSTAKRNVESSPTYDMQINYKFAIVRNQIDAGYSFVMKKKFEINVGAAVGLTYLVNNKSYFHRELAYTSTFTTTHKVDLEPEEKSHVTSAGILTIRYQSFLMQYQMLFSKGYFYLSDDESDFNESRLTLGWMLPRRK